MSVSMQYGQSAAHRNGSVNYPLAVSLGGTGGASVGSAFTVASTTITDTQSRAAGATFNLSADANEVDGYTPLCICGWSSSGMTYLTIANLYMDSDAVLHWSGRNLGSSAVTPSMTVRVLYARSE